nr:ribonuclease H-like domain-containing protein [Tanacetum cinerariifolium]
MLTMEEMRMKSRAQHTLVDDTSSSPMVLLENSDPNTRRSTFFTEKVGQQQSPSGFSVSSGQLVGQETTLPHAFTTRTLQDPASVGDGHSILVTNSGNSILPTSSRPLHFHNLNLILLVFLLRTSKLLGFRSTVIALDLSILLRIPDQYLRSISPVNTSGINVLDIQEMSTIYFLTITLRFWCLGPWMPVFFAVCGYFTPPGFWDPTHPDYVCLSKISLRSQAGSSGLRKYATEILGQAHMANCNPSQTPVDTESIINWVMMVCLHMHDPREPHFSALKRILLYVLGTLDYGLQLFSSSTSLLLAYLDADWVGYPIT